MDLFENKKQPSIDSRKAPAPKLSLPAQGQMLRSNASRSKDIDSLFASYQKSQDRAALGKLVTGLKPAIDKAIYRHVGAPDPVLRGQAKKLVAAAMPKYDPSLASLETFVSQQTRPLIRYQSRRKRVVKTPDELQMQATTVGNAYRAFEAENGRSPSNHELADTTGIPLKKLKKIRAFDTQVMAGSTQTGEEGNMQLGEQGVFDDATASMSFVNLIRDDLPPVDQSIMEHTLGLEGSEVLSNAELAKRLNLSPGAVSQRKAKIQKILDRETNLNPFQ